MTQAGGWTAPPTTLVIPPGATSGARTVYGAGLDTDPPLPQDIIDYYVTNYATAPVSATLHYATDQQIYYELTLAGGAWIYADGWYVQNTATLVWEVHGRSIMKPPNTALATPTRGTTHYESPGWTRSPVEMFEGDTFGTTSFIGLDGAFLCGLAVAGPSGAIGAEAALLTAIAQVDFQPDRAYRIRFGGACTGSVANVGTWRLRKDNAVGVVVAGAWNLDVPVASRWREWETIVINTTGVVQTFAPCITLAASAGTITVNGAGTRPYYFDCISIGSAAQYSGHPSV